MFDSNLDIDLGKEMAEMSSINEEDFKKREQEELERFNAQKLFMENLEKPDEDYINVYNIINEALIKKESFEKMLELQKKEEEEEYKLEALADLVNKVDQ